MKHFIVTAHLVVHAANCPEALLQVAGKIPPEWHNLARLTVEEATETCPDDPMFRQRNGHDS